MDKKIILFGAGDEGKKAISFFGNDLIECFIDNNKNKNGTMYCGKPVFNFEELTKIAHNYRIIISSRIYSQEIAKQLNSAGIYNYSHFKKSRNLFDTNDLIINRYKTNCERTEIEWIEVNESTRAWIDANIFVEKVADNIPLFGFVELETINRCNGSCSFCPANKNVDIRKEMFMSFDLFENIINQLSDLNYTGYFALSSNNEPFLDERIIDFAKYANEKLTQAHICMYTNGTLLSVKKFKEIISYLNELIIDNYNNNLSLIEPCKKIKEYIENNNPELSQKVTICIRKQNEILNSRGGLAVNRKNIQVINKAKCSVPYHKMTIRPDGKVSLCCSDTYGKFTLGDLKNESLVDVWYGNEYTKIRTALQKGRGAIDYCKNCDHYGFH